MNNMAAVLTQWSNEQKKALQHLHVYTLSQLLLLNRMESDVL